MYTEEIQAVATALVREIREHGAPNKFSPGELWSRHNVLTPRQLGKVGIGYAAFLTRMVSAEIPGLTIGYADRHFVVNGVH